MKYGLINQRESGHGDGPFPIPSVLGQGKKTNKDIFPGTQYAKRITDIIEGRNGVQELLEFFKNSVNELPEKAYFSTNSESKRSELEETRLDAHQALLRIETLIQQMKLGVDEAAKP